MKYLISNLKVVVYNFLLMRPFQFAHYFLIVLFTLSCKKEPENREPVSYIDPFIGTGGHGHTYPGATVPFGMVQLSPQTRLDGWDGCSGYHFSDTLIYGFAHTALSGTGVSDYGDILIMPGVGEIVFDQKEYASPFYKNTEKAEAGYYGVKLEKPQVLAELTATTRVGYHRYTFPASELSHLIIDLKHRDEVVESWIELVSDTEIRGMRRSTNWAKDMVWYFHMVFSKPFTRMGIAQNDSLLGKVLKAEGKNIKAFVGFQTAEGESVEVKVGLSAVDAEGARNNLLQEIPAWGFEKVRLEAADAWNKAVSVIRVKGGSEHQLRVFYTAMYHAMLQPNTFMDADRRYRGIDRGVHLANGFTNYTVFSLWDTYRAWHPLMTIIDQNRTLDFIRTMLSIHEKTGILPVWELAGNETFCMIGNHAIPVITDAWMKGIQDFDGHKALNAMIESAGRPQFGLDIFREYGYIPGDKEHESVSKSLEYGYNDWCIATMADDLGIDSLSQVYYRGSQSYKNYFDQETGFMRPRLNGGFIKPFDPTVVDWHFTEANSWQYSFYVPHDVSGLACLHGGKDQLASKIDQLFSTAVEVGGRDMKDITGLIGQYAHGNEPSHHMAYLYNYLGQSWKTQEKVHYIMNHFYTDKADGLIGNEDCGQMSAWFIFSAMGFYPVCPGSTDYALGTPFFDEISIQLENSKTFNILAENLSQENFYIQSAKLNGQEYHLNYLQHDDIMQGGSLQLVMGNSPNKNRDSEEKYLIQTAVKRDNILPVPVIDVASKRIKTEAEVVMMSQDSGAVIYYTLDGSVPNGQSIEYSGPLRLDKSAVIRAVAYTPALGYSKIAEAEIVKINSDYSSKLTYPFHPNYSGGGDDALIDGIRGAANWRLGGWQGFQGTDLELTVDLGKQKYVKGFAMGFLQDVRSWIWMPSELIYETSTDGKVFTQRGILFPDVSPTDEGLIIKDLEGRIGHQTRFIRVKARNFGTIPSWHLGAGGAAYIFSDEMIIH